MTEASEIQYIDGSYYVTDSSYLGHLLKTYIGKEEKEKVRRDALTYEKLLEAHPDTAEDVFRLLTNKSVPYYKIFVYLLNVRICIDLTKDSIRRSAINPRKKHGDDALH